MKRISLTYGEWYEKSIKIAFNLSSYVKKGDLVCLFSKNEKNPVLVFTALQILGAQTCMIATERHLQCQMKNYKFETIFLSQDFLTENVKSLTKNVDKIVLLDGHSDEGHINFETLLTEADSNFVENLPIVNPDDVTILLQSSGSTGIPKLICKDQLAVIHMAVEVYRLTKCKNFFNDRTLSHVGGLFSVFSSALGQTIVSTTIPMAGNTDNILKICKNEKIEACFFVLYFFYDLIQKRKEVIEHLTDLKVITTGGQIPINSIVKQMAQILPNVPIYDIYGSTEVGCIFVKCLANGNHFEPCIAQAISIRDKDGKVLKRNETGEIWVLPRHGYHGYYGKPAPTALSWERMSDIGIITPEGRLQIFGRTSDILHIGMLKVNPFVYEEKLNDIDEIEKAVVVGIPDERLGETMCAVVKLSKSYSEKVSIEKARNYILDWCQQNIHGNETIGLIAKIEKLHILTGDWPRSALGKLIRKDVRSLVTEKLRKAEA